MFPQKMPSAKFLVISLSTLFLFTLSVSIPLWASPLGAADTPDQPAQRLQSLQQQLGASLTLAYRNDGASQNESTSLNASQSESKILRFLGSTKDHLIPVQESTLNAAASSSVDSNSPEAAARAFLLDYGALFGIADPGSDLRTMRQWSVADSTLTSRSFVRFQQVHQGVPVLGGDFTVQTVGKSVLSAGGRIIAPQQLAAIQSVSPQITADVASQRARQAVAQRYQVADSSLTVSTPGLWLYNPTVFRRANDLTHLVWQMEVSDAARMGVHEFVLVDASQGRILLHFSQLESALNRTIYDNQNNPALSLPGNGPVRVEGGGSTGVSDADLAYDYAGDTYNFYQSNFGRDSLDNRGMGLVSTVRYCDPGASCPYANAFWNGEQMVYGEGFASADDVVGHELTHGVTEFESHLYYYMQSGAINEALSDIFGEYIDLTNGNGNDDNSVRWLMGEDVPIGAIRSMEDPTIFGDPDSTISDNYYCDTVYGDNGGVHINSGIVNKTAFLMTDGGSLNGVSVQGLGVAKASQIWYETASNLLNSASDFQDLGNALPQACFNLVGNNGITSDDCQQVQNAVDATLLLQRPQFCSLPKAPICEDGLHPNYLFQDDLENPASGNWQPETLSGQNAWYYPQNNNPYGIDLTYATSGRYNIVGDNLDVESDSALQMSRDVLLPNGNTAYLRFNHSFEFEADWISNVAYDGGLVEYSTDQGATWHEVNTFNADNGYNGYLDGGPLSGSDAFVDFSAGYTASRFHLDSLSGENVRFRFRISTDDGNYFGGWGWFIDDIDIYTCAEGAPPATATPTDESTATPTKSPTATPTATTTPPTPTAVPATPTPIPLELKVESGNKSMELNWNVINDADVTHYRVLRSPQDGNSLQSINDNVNTTSYLDEDDDAGNDLQPEETYCYQVEALREDGSSSQKSNVACAKFGVLDLWIPDRVGSPGDTVIVPVNIRNANGLRVGSADIWLNFNAAVLESLSISNTALTAAYSWESSVQTVDATTSRVRISTIAGQNAATLHGDGSFFWLHFKVLGRVGDESPLDLKEFIENVGGSEISDENANPIQPLSMTDGKFRVTGGTHTSYALGDLSGDGVVNARDAQLALSIASGRIIPTAEQLQAGDINGNGVIQAADASMILYYAAHGEWPPVNGTSEIDSANADAPINTTLQLLDGTGATGGSAQLVLRATNLTRMAGGKFIIAYNPAVVTGIEVAPQDLGTNYTLFANNSKAGLLVITLAKGSETSGNGDLARLTLHLATNATPGSHTVRLQSAEIGYLNGLDFVSNSAENSLMLGNAQITITQPVQHKIFLPTVQR